MSDRVLNVKKHTCPTCGGQLRVDLSRQMYECPFCGVTFDYAYFNEDDVIDRATRSLLAGEFHSAAEAYDFMLTKEPNNFSALRGRILASAAARNLSELESEAKLMRMDNGAVSASVQQAISACRPEHAPYFSKMNELLEAGKEYKEEQQQIHALRKDRKQHLQKLHKLEEEKDEVGVTVRDPDDPYGTTIVNPKPMLILSLVIYGLWILLLLSVFLWIPNAPGATKTTTRRTNGYVVSTSNRSTNTGKTKAYTKLEVPGQESDLPEIEDDAWESIYEDYILVVETNPNESSARRLETELEKRQREKEEKEKENDKKVKRTLTILIILSTLGEGAVAFALLRKMRIQKEYDVSISSVLETTDGLGGEISTHVDKSAHLRRKIHQLVREMEKLDPEPDTPLSKVSTNGRRKRWM